GNWDKMIAWSPDGKQIVSAQQGTIRFWDPASGQLAAQIESEDPVCRAFAFTPDGKQIVSVGNLNDDTWQPVTRFWDATTRQEVRTVKWIDQGRPIGLTALVIDWRVAATVTHEAVVSVRDLDSGVELAREKLVARSINRLWLSPDGKVVAAV